MYLRAYLSQLCLLRGPGSKDTPVAMSPPKYTLHDQNQGDTAGSRVGAGKVCGLGTSVAPKSKEIFKQ